MSFPIGSGAEPQPQKQFGIFRGKEMVAIISLLFVVIKISIEVGDRQNRQTTLRGDYITDTAGITCIVYVRHRPEDKM